MKEKINIRVANLNTDWAIVDMFLQELHESERTLNSHTALWKDICVPYMNHVKSCIEECDGRLLIAEFSGEPIGFIFGYLDEQDDSNFELGTDNDLYISEGYVKPAFRQLGVYSMLNKSFEEAYANYPIRKIYRYTLFNNQPMNNWLTKQGYNPVRIVYEKWLKD